MTMIEPQTAGAGAFSEGVAAATVDATAGADIADESVVNEPAQGAGAVDGTKSLDGESATSAELKTLLRESEATASAAAKSGASSGVVKLVETVVALVANLVTLISSLIIENKKTKSSTGSANNDSPGASSPSSASKSAGSGASSNSPVVDKVPAESTKQVTTSPAVGQPRLQAVADETGRITVRTPDGFMIKTENQQQAWQIIGPDGRATRIWGDPHVHESDGNKWDFHQQSSFVFGNNKVTVETAPHGNGKTVTRRITVYNGSERVTIGGIHLNRPSILAVSGDGMQHDDGLSDGVKFTRRLTKTGESWSKSSGGRVDVMGK